MSLLDDDEPLPETMELRPGGLKWLGVFAISTTFVAIAIWIGPRDPVLFWACGGFFLLCALVALSQMSGIGSRLLLDAEGFTCTTLFKSFRRKWVECSPFAPIQAGPNRMVGFAAAQDIAAHPKLAAVAEAMTGAPGALPDTFGLSASELSELMNAFRARALSRAGG